jgi:multisubunit Na+/H+ antiporter MnhB subunit
MEGILIAVLILMMAGALYALEAKDLLSAVVSYGIVGFGLVICFLLLQAPDLAIVQIIIETISLIIMIAVILNSTREEIASRQRSFVVAAVSLIFALFFLYIFNQATGALSRFGEHTMRMASAYVQGAAAKTGSANLVTGIVFDFRGYDTLGEATILFTAVMGVLTVLRLRGRKAAGKKEGAE